MISTQRISSFVYWLNKPLLSVIGGFSFQLAIWLDATVLCDWRLVYLQWLSAERVRCLLISTPRMKYVRLWEKDYTAQHILRHCEPISQASRFIALTIFPSTVSPTSFTDSFQILTSRTRISLLSKVLRKQFCFPIDSFPMPLVYPQTLHSSPHLVSSSTPPFSRPIVIAQRLQPQINLKFKSLSYLIFDATDTLIDFWEAAISRSLSLSLSLSIQLLPHVMRFGSAHLPLFRISREIKIFQKGRKISLLPFLFFFYFLFFIFYFFFCDLRKEGLKAKKAAAWQATRGGGEYSTRKVATLWEFVSTKETGPKIFRISGLESVMPKMFTISIYTYINSLITYSLPSCKTD